MEALVTPPRHVVISAPHELHGFGANAPSASDSNFSGE